MPASKQFLEKREPLTALFAVGKRTIVRAKRVPPPLREKTESTKLLRKFC